MERGKYPSGIYQLESKINGKVYIGSSNNLERRKTEHLRKLKNRSHENILLINHVNKYGIDDLIFSIKEYCPIYNLVEREQHYLDILMPKFNISPTAKNNTGLKLSELQLIKLRERASKQRGTPIDQYSLDGKYIATYNSVSEASRKTNSKSIQACIENKCIRSGGFLWTHKGKSINETLIRHKKGNTINKKHLIPVTQFNSQGIFIKIFNSIKEAQLETKVSGISLYLSGKNKRAGNFIWTKGEMPSIEQIEYLNTDHYSIASKRKWQKDGFREKWKKVTVGSRSKEEASKTSKITWARKSYEEKILWGNNIRKGQLNRKNKIPQHNI